jgi:hypothetical protein
MSAPLRQCVQSGTLDIWPRIRTRLSTASKIKRANRDLGWTVVSKTTCRTIASQPVNSSPEAGDEVISGLRKPAVCDLRDHCSGPGTIDCPMLSSSRPNSVQDLLFLLLREQSQAPGRASLGMLCGRAHVLTGPCARCTFRHAISTGNLRSGSSELTE